MMRSISSVAIFAALVLGAAFGALLYSSDTVRAVPAFQIVDVRSEYGHLVVEVQHFNPDGSHWFFEHYTFQGRENNRQPRVTDQLGRGSTRRMFIKSDGRVAPTRLNSDGERQHYLPDGEEWLRHNRPHLDEDAILKIISRIHTTRLATGWTKGPLRLTTRALGSTPEDNTGADSLLSRFSGMKDIAYRQKEGSTALAPMPAVPLTLGHGTQFGTVSSFYSDPNTGATTVDGDVINDTTTSWSSIRDATSGTDATPTNDTIRVAIRTHTVSSDYIQFRRGYGLFDTSTLGAGAVVSAATWTATPITISDDLGGGGEIAFVDSSPASDNNLVVADWQTGVKIGTTKQAPNVTIASLTADSATPSTWTLNATGRGNINVTGVSKFGQRVERDRADSEPTWASNERQRMIFGSTDENLPGDQRPVLTVTHTTPLAAITGTIGDGATEQEVRDGDGTIIVTLSGVTWVAAGATFDAQRQAIIDGIDSAQSETYGWNAEVRDQIGVASVVRTSSTIATVTITASEVADYRIDSSETLTVTVPAAAHSGASDITATPTITITTGAESVAVSGTLGASGGTPAEIRAGGETIILTLTDTTWVASGATFDAERQAILNGLDSNLADANGWDNRRSDFAVGDVERTGATVVTITLSASTAYAIPQTETITAVVPASAMVYGAALTGSPTFNIVPVFQDAGNRVSGAIDLSSITEVAYCAIGWAATTPTHTSVTVSTSVDGGANYSSATDGECPTGLTVGGSLSAITDFRIKVTLDTTDSTVTPLVEALGLLVQDTAGPALYYQLNTVPGVTITDRSAGSNTGTMSFPVSQTGVNATTGVLESTRSTLSLEQLLSVGDIVSPVTGAAASGNIFNQTETGFGSLPFQSMMETMATGGELPLKFVWVVAIGLFSIALGVIALHLTGSLMISGVGMGAGLSVGAAIGAGLIPGWTVILFVILALALIVMRSRGALPL